MKNANKQYTIEVLKNGGHIGESEIYHEIRLYDKDDNKVASLMQLTLDKLVAEGIVTKSTVAWTYYNTYKMKPTLNVKDGTWNSAGDYTLDAVDKHLQDGMDYRIEHNNDWEWLKIAYKSKEHTEWVLCASRRYASPL
jgi:hypothetical protein